MNSRAKFILIISCVAFFSLCSEIFSATNNKKLLSIKDINGSEVGIYSESHALVIGATDYAGIWPDLPGVEKDIRSVKEALEAKGFNVILVRNPNSQELENAFEGFIAKYGYKPNNRLLFYFAGHGHTIKPKYGGEELGYIVPVEAPSPYNDFVEFRRVAMSMKRIEEYALNIDAKHALFIFDSCFSGSLFALSRAVPEHISYKTAKPVRQFITSGSADETVPDTSIFRQQFIDALDGEGDLNDDGYVTAAELSSFIFTNVVNYSRGAQHPQYGKIRNPNLDKGDFVFRVAQLESMKTDISDSSLLLEVERRRLAEEKERLERERKELEELKLLAMPRQKLEAERSKIESQKNHIETASLAQEKIEKPREDQLEKTPNKKNEEALQVEVEQLKLQLAKIEDKETKNIKEIGRDVSFIAYDDGTVLDTATNLMWWSKNLEASSWHNAQYKIKVFRGGGYSDWRLPTISELKTIYDKSSNNKYKTVAFISLTTQYIFSQDLSDETWREEFLIKYLNFKNGRVGSTARGGSHLAPGNVLYLPVRNVN